MVDNGHGDEGHGHGGQGGHWTMDMEVVDMNMMAKFLTNASMPPGGQICNQCMWCHHLVAKLLALLWDEMF